MSPPLSRHLSPPQVLAVDPHIWKACSGIYVQVPKPNSRVYYFPEGHAEQADSAPAFSPRVFSAACIPCRVLSVAYLARRDTDEVYAKIRLRPTGRVAAEDGEVGWTGGFQETEKMRLKSFAKVLTPSDANNGGGFSMPKACAEVFPPLDFESDPPVQTQSMTDLHGNVWEFRHIYRGTPRRHLLTTGWSKFVNNKKLIHGDSVVFMRDTRKSTNSYYIGVRRAMSWTARYGGGSAGDGTRRRLLGKVPSEEVREAVELAVSGEEFEVVYYPGAGFSNFVVNAELVERTLRTHWRPEVKVKMVLEMEEPSRLMPLSGKVVSVLGSSSEHGIWRGGTPWRMLQIKWDDSAVMKDEDRLSPWEVEFEIATLQQQVPPAAVHPLVKRQKLLHVEDLQPINNRVVQAEEPTFITSPPRSFNPSTNVAGIQGARLDHHHHPYNAPVSITSPKFPPTPDSRALERTADIVQSSPSSQAGIAAAIARTNGLVQNNNNENKDSSPESVGIGDRNKNNRGSFQLFGKTISYGVKPDEETDGVGE